MINEVKAVWPWMGNVVEAVYTVAHGLWVTFRTWIKTYRPDAKRLPSTSNTRSCPFRWRPGIAAFIASI